MRILGYIVMIFCSIFLVGWSSGDQKPKKGELQDAYKGEIPKYMQLIDFDVEILENMGNKVDPLWGSRFKAVVKTKEHLYKKDGKDYKRKITYLVRKSKKGTAIEVYGKIYSKPYRGKWKHDFKIDGSPISDLGDRKRWFRGKHVFVRGSQEEKEYFAKVKTEKVRKDKVIAGAREKLERNIANANQILVGNWEYKGGNTNSQNKSATVINFGADGSWNTQCKKSFRDDLQTHIGTWKIYGRDLIFTTLKRERFYSNDTIEILKDPLKVKCPIKYLDTNKMIVNCKWEVFNYAKEFHKTNKTTGVDRKLLSAGRINMTNPETKKISTNTVKVEKKKPKSYNSKSKDIIDDENNIALKTNPTSLKLKKEKAIKLVAYTLENGKIDIEKTLSYEGKLLFGVTLTKSFTHLKKFQCKEYRVISYESGKAITKLDPGKVCKVKGKWYPYILLTNSSRKSVPGDEFIKAMIGRW